VFLRLFVQDKSLDGGIRMFLPVGRLAKEDSDALSDGSHGAVLFHDAQWPAHRTCSLADVYCLSGRRVIGGGVNDA
jgi:hypothetical protein